MKVGNKELEFVDASMERVEAAMVALDSKKSNSIERIGYFICRELSIVAVPKGKLIHVDLKNNTYTKAFLYAINELIIERDYATLAKIDFSNLSFIFEKRDVIEFDFSALHNVSFNPQKVYNKCLYDSILSGVDFDNMSFKDVSLQGTDFTGAKNVYIDPQTIEDKSLSYCILNGVDFTGKSFDGAEISFCDFTGSKGAKINPQTIKDKLLDNCVFKDVDFTGNSFDGAFTGCSDFTGSKGAIINPQTIGGKAFINENLCDVDFDNNSFDGVGIEDCSFVGASNLSFGPDKFDKMVSEHLTEEDNKELMKVKSYIRGLF